jgi:hypothetical protein
MLTDVPVLKFYYFINKIDIIKIYTLHKNNVKNE